MSNKNNIDNEIVDLNTKVDMFINWYYENMIKGKYTDYGEYRFPIEMRDFIEKIAIWYELRYPKYKIHNLMYGIDEEEINLNKLLDKDFDIDGLEWTDFYNTNVFFKLLPWEEKLYFNKPRQKGIITLKCKNNDAHLFLTKNDIIESADNIESYTKGLLDDEDLEGFNLHEVKELFEDMGIRLPNNNEIDQEIKRIDNWNYQRNGILDCAMYRIIERGGNRIGSRRAYLFAKEFDRNIDIPMKYAIDYSDPSLRLFVNEYLKEGGSKDLECYVDYFSRTTDKENVSTISIKNLLLRQRNNAMSFYTPEEDELHQRLVNAIATERKNKMLKKRHYYK